MSLLTAFNVARSSLSAIATQTSLTSRNVAGAGDPAYSRKYVNLTDAIGGEVVVSGVNRAFDSSLRTQALDSTSTFQQSNTVVEGYTSIDQLLGTADSASYMPTLLTSLQSSLQTYAANPGNDTLGANVLNAAQSLTRGLNQASTGLYQARLSADADIATSVRNINDLLSQYAKVDADISRNYGTGNDVTTMLDQRDKILASLSQEIGIRVADRGNGSLGIYTTSGIVLYDVSPRSVTFQANSNLTAGNTGAAVYIDGVDATSSNSPMPITGGRLTGAVAVRDKVLPDLQKQIDELARSVISTFAESDQSATPTLPNAPGLFTWSGAPAIPGSPPTPGLAGQIMVNSAADPDQGGSLLKIRDGGLAGASYVYNTTGGASFTDRLRGMSDAMDATQSFDASLGLISQGSIKGYSSSFVGKLEADRKSATDYSNNTKVIDDRFQQALTNVSGVNLDDEMARMLDLEHSYTATAKLITAIDGMLQDILKAVN